MSCGSKTGAQLEEPMTTGAGPASSNRTDTLWRLPTSLLCTVVKRVCRITKPYERHVASALGFLAFPSRIAVHQIPTRHFVALAHRAIPVLRYLERVIHPLAKRHLARPTPCGSDRLDIGCRPRFSFRFPRATSSRLGKIIGRNDGFDGSEDAHEKPLGARILRCSALLNQTMFWSPRENHAHDRLRKLEAILADSHVVIAHRHSHIQV
jgi:hypothetical protein